jgi:hypothetical protein
LESSCRALSDGAIVFLLQPFPGENGFSEFFSKTPLSLKSYGNGSVTGATLGVTGATLGPAQPCCSNTTISFIHYKIEYKH